MAMITSALLNGIRTAFRSDFQKALEGVSPQWNEVATEVPSSTKSNTYGWLDTMPVLREWVVARLFQLLNELCYAISNKKFDSSVDVGRDDIEDVHLGFYKPIVQEMAREGGLFSYELLFVL